MLHNGGGSSFGASRDKGSYVYRVRACNFAGASPYSGVVFKDPAGRCPRCLWGAPIGVVVKIGAQMAMAEGSMGERFSQVKWGQVAAATAAGALSGGVSAVASTAATTCGTIAANVVGNAAVGAFSVQANAQLEGKAASISEVAKGAALSGVTAGLGAAVSTAPSVAARSASADLTQAERAAAGNMMQGIKEAAPGFKYSNPTQAAANAAGAAVSSSGDLEPLVNDTSK